jgi:hypothetical protein
VTQRLLVDSHMLLALVVTEPNRSVRRPMPWSPDDLLFASAASLWEIAIKVRLGKLDLDMQVEEFPGYWSRSVSACSPSRLYTQFTSPRPSRRRAIRSTACCWPNAQSRTCGW